VLIGDVKSEFDNNSNTFTITAYYQPYYEVAAVAFEKGACRGHTTSGWCARVLDFNNPQKHINGNETVAPEQFIAADSGTQATLAHEHLHLYTSSSVISLKSAPAGYKVVTHDYELKWTTAGFHARHPGDESDSGYSEDAGSWTDSYQIIDGGGCSGACKLVVLPFELAPSFSTTVELHNALDNLLITTDAAFSAVDEQTSSSSFSEKVNAAPGTFHFGWAFDTAVSRSKSASYQFRATALSTSYAFVPDGANAHDVVTPGDVRNALFIISTTTMGHPR
jgi:hypothetical protein